MRRRLLLLLLHVARAALLAVIHGMLAFERFQSLLPWTRAASTRRVAVIRRPLADVLLYHPRDDLQRVKTHWSVVGR